MNNKGLWLISQALDQLDEECTAKKKEKKKRTLIAEPESTLIDFRKVATKAISSKAISNNDKITKMNCDKMHRGDLMNDKKSLCLFFSSFGVVISTPLECFSQVEKDGRLISKKVQKPLPAKFTRMAAALVVHHR